MGERPAGGASRPITGTWIDFYHVNDHEGDLWNDAVARWPDEAWELKVAEMAAAGLDTLVVGAVAVAGRPFYPSRLMPDRWRPLAAADPVAAVLRSAERHGLGVYLGVGFFQDDTGALGATAGEGRLRQDVPRELADRYGAFDSFAGWYLPVEAGIDGHFPDAFRRYADAMSAACRRAAELAILIAPYGTRTVEPDARFVQQLRDLPVTHIAYQDEVGVQKTRVEELEGIYRRLEMAHREAGRPLWTDVELFSFQGEVYRSPLLPAPPERVARQVAAQSPLVEKVLAYQFLGLLNAPHTPCPAGHPDGVGLYEALARQRILAPPAR